MKKHFSVLFTLGLIFAGGCSLTQDKIDYSKNYDYLIREGMVIDGSGESGRKADILIQGDRIVFIGSVDTSKIAVREMIDAKGMIVTPGFIETHAHGSPVKTPEFQNFTAMGVTTLFLGQDGFSSAKISDWMKQVEAARPAPNIATLIGHGSVRKQAGVGLNPNPSNEDLQRMAKIVDEALKAGCFGLSTGLEYQPGIFANLEELIAIAQPVGQRGGIVHSHMRSEDDDAVQDAISELVAQGKGGGCAVHISHLKVVYGQGTKRAEEILAQIDAARQNGIPISADMYPYTASFTGIGIVFPEWAKPPYEYIEVATTRRAELANHLRKRVNLRNGPESTLIGTAPWAEKTLAQVAAELDKPFEDVLIDDIGPDGASAAYFVMNQELQDRLIIDPHVMICSDGSPTMRHPRGYGSFAKVIRYYVMEQKLLSMEEAIHKMTGIPAATMKLLAQKRGLLKPGFAADILIFDPQKIQDTATFENPHQFAKGFDWVMVNGTLIRSNGEFTSNRSGKMLRKQVD